MATYTLPDSFVPEATSPLSLSVGGDGVIVCSSAAVDALSSSLTTTWVKGLVFNADGSIARGFHDADKNMENDSLMCWAASASNVIAWWQEYYGTTSYAVGTVPESADDIFEQFRQNWNNVGNNSLNGFKWWMCGTTAHDYVGDGTAGGYYSNKYTESNVSAVATTVSLYDASAVSVADFLTSTIEQGGIVSLSLSIYDGSTREAGHAVTLWGVTRDEETGCLTSLYINDSNDGWDNLFSVDVRYDEVNGYYRLVGEYGRLGYYYSLTNIEVLVPFQKSDSTAPALPTNLKVQVQNQFATFSWTGSQDSSGIFYEISVEGPDGSSDWSIASETSMTMELSQSGSYKWWVRSRDGMGNISSLVYGSTFTCSVSAPKLDVWNVSQKAGSVDTQLVTFSWDCDVAATYTLTVNGEVVYSGSSSAVELTLREGEYTYAVTATYGGISTTRSGNTFFCDTTAPGSPSNLKAVQQGNQVVFSWNGVSDASGVSYVMAWKRSGESSYTYFRNISDTSITLTPPQSGSYSWRVFAIDGAGRTSSWADGSAITFELRAPTLTLLEPTKTRLSDGVTELTLSWSCDTTSTYKVLIGGKTFDVGDKNYLTVNAEDGVYDYTVVATSSQGLSSSLEGSVRCDSLSPSQPTGLKVELQGDKLVFSWNAVSDASGVTYSLSYRRSTETEWSYHWDFAENSFSMAPLADGTYYWSVLVRDGEGNHSGWTTPLSFSSDLQAPTLTVTPPTQKKTAAGRADVTFSWKADEAATFTLVVDGSLVYSGSLNSYTLSLADGFHSYSITATDALGNSSVRNTSMRVDTTAPTSPSGLRMVLEEQGAKARFSWLGSEDVSGVTYELAYKATSSADYTTISGLTAESLLVSLPVTGFYNWRVRAVDGKGNYTSWVWGSSFHNDLTAPTLTVRPPTQKKTGTEKAAVTFSWKADEYATFTLVVDGKQVYKGTAASYTLTLAEGFHRYSVTATDAAGNSSVRNTSMRVDTTAPTNPAGLKMELLEQGAKARFSWLGSEDISGVTYELAYKATSSADYTTLTGLTSGSQTVVLPVSGFYNWRVRAVDSKGNYTAWVWGSSFNNDLTAPVLDVRPPTQKVTATGKAAVTFSWKADEYAIFTLVVDGKQVYKGTAASYTLHLADGFHSYSVTATDAAGNSSVRNTSMRVDTTPPAKPSSLKVQLQSQGAKAVFSWTGSSDISGVTYELAYMATSSKDFTYCTGLSATKASIALSVSGFYNWKVRARDGKGNYSAWVWGSSFNNDFTAPVLDVRPPTQKKTATGKADVTFSWKADEYAIFTLVVDGKQVYKGSASSYTLNLADGYHSYSITATDAAGNSSVRNTSMRVDTQPPAKPSSLKAQVTQQGKQVTFTWTGVEDISGVTYELAYMTTKAGDFTYSTGLTSPRATISLSSMAYYNWKVRAKDGKGNYSSWVWGSSFHSDITPPVLTVKPPTQKKTAAGKADVTFSWWADETSTYVLTVDGKQVYKGSGKSCTLSLADGYHSYSISATDAVGNRSVRNTSMRVDTMAPTNPTGLTVKLQNQGSKAVFSWTASEDISGVTYDLACKASWESDYTYYRDLTTNSQSLNLLVNAVFYWFVRAVDSKGNATEWVEGDSFNNAVSGLSTPTLNSSLVSAAPTLVSQAQGVEASAGDTPLKVCALDRELALSAGACNLLAEGSQAVVLPDSTTGLELENRTRTVTQTMLA